MASLNKVARMTIRLTPEQEKRAAAAAAIVSRQKGEAIKPSTLIREIAMPHIDEIIATAGARGVDRGRAA